MISVSVWIDAWRDAIDQALVATCPEIDPEGLAAERLLQAMHYAALGGGKRLRPLLALAACRAAGGEEQAALPAGVAIEMIHAYSLVHDDLPAMDNDALRRGRPTTHIVYGEALGILAGDALQTLAFEVLAASDLPAERRVRQIYRLARAAGAAGMAGGQTLDLQYEGLRGGSPPTPEIVLRIHRLKTGALLRASLEIGAEAGGADAETMERMGRIGDQVGLAFQIHDDVLDLTASTDQLGKTAGKDQASGKLTYPGLVGIERAQAEAARLIDGAHAEIRLFGAAGQPLAALVERVVTRDS